MEALAPILLINATPQYRGEDIMAVSAAATAAIVHAVSLKLPTFLASRPDAWFQQTEAQFAMRNITDSTTKYFYLLTSLDPVVAERWPEMWQQYLQKASTST